MFQRFHDMVEEREGGFTLIELLVVVLIIAILAAIAIPFFLRQRERSFESQAQSSLKNAATAMESYATDNGGTYAAVDAAAPPGDLVAQGYRDTATVALTIETVDNAAGTYCLEANHTNLSANWRYSNTTGEPVEGDCP
jgi:type IV pilus assembly protein PilA